MDSFDDEVLVRDLRSGVGTARRLLFEAHAPRLWRVLYRLTGDYDEAHDLTQDAMLHAFRKIGSYDGRGSLAAWLARIGVNLARDELRKRRRRAHRLDSAPVRPTEPAPRDPLLAARVERAMGELSEAERVVVVMHDLEGYTHEEIGAALDMAAGSSRARLSRARARLRQRLGTLTGEDRK